MDAGKTARLQRVGWRVGGASEFLGLTEEEERLVRLRLALVDAVRKARRLSGLSQSELAERMHSSQSRVAKIEAGEPSVSLDLIMRALITAGASDNDVARAISPGSRRTGR